MRILGREPSSTKRGRTLKQGARLVQWVRILDRESRRVAIGETGAVSDAWDRTNVVGAKSGKVDAINDEGADSGTETVTDGAP